MLELAALHHGVIQMRSICFSRGADSFDFAAILLDSCDESPTDQKILDFTAIFIESCRRKCQYDEREEAEELILVINDFEKVLAEAGPDVITAFHARLIGDVRAVEARVAEVRAAGDEYRK